jgi:hypothetical protein
MKIIDRYIGMSVIATAFFGVVVLSLVLVLGNLFKQLLDVLINNPDVPIATVLAFMALVLPFSLTFTIPWGFLTALLLVFGRISADNELIALKSNGISIPRICIPVFVLAAVLSGICFWINIEVAPRAEQQMTKTIVDIATSNPAALFRSDEVVDQFPDLAYDLFALYLDFFGSYLRISHVRVLLARGRRSFYLATYYTVNVPGGFAQTDLVRSRLLQRGDTSCQERSHFCHGIGPGIDEYDTRIACSGVFHLGRNLDFRMLSSRRQHGRNDHDLLGPRVRRLVECDGHVGRTELVEAKHDFAAGGPSQLTRQFV